MSWEDRAAPIEQSETSQGWQNRALPIDGVGGSAIPNTQINEPQQNGFGALDVYANAPFSGLLNAAVDAGLGGAQIGADILDKSGLYNNNLSQKISDFKKYKDADISQSMDNNTPAQVMYGGGNLAGNAEEFALLGGNAKLVGSAIDALPSIAQKTVSYAPALLAGGLSSALMPADNEEQRLNNAGFGAGAAGAGQILGNVLSTQIKNPEKLALMASAESNNIPLYRNQLSDSRFVKGLAAVLRNVPLSGSSGAKKAQVNAFQNAIGETVGLPAGSINSGRLGEAFDNLSNNYNTVKQNPFVGSPAFDAEIQTLKTQAARGLPKGLDQEKTFSHFVNVLDNTPAEAINAEGQVNGDYVKGLISDIRTAGRGSNSSPALNQLGTTINKQWAAGMLPDDAALTELTDQQYRNAISLEGPVGNNPNGPLNPSALQGGVKRVFDNYATGGDSQLENLSRLGQLTKDSFPDSGTAFHEKAFDALKHIAGVTAVGGTGALAGHEADSGDHLGELGGIAAALAASRYGLSPYVFAKMSTKPSVSQSLAPALANALMKQNQENE